MDDRQPETQSQSSERPPSVAITTVTSAPVQTRIIITPLPRPPARG